MTSNRLPRWAPRVARRKIRQLYESDARGIYDLDLIHEVGYSLLARCESFITANRARAGDLPCPECGRDRPGGRHRNGFSEFYVAAVRSGLTRKKMYDHLGYSPLAYECLEVQAIERKIEDLRLCFDLQKEIMNQGNDFASFVEIA